jgi:hypothetical protein
MTFSRRLIFSPPTTENSSLSLITSQKRFIIKPEGSCQGRGIFLVQHPDQVPEGERYIAQKYLTKPFLLDGMKFDLRIYALVASCDPLRIYVYKEGLARLATAVYCAPSKKNISNSFMHLTNYAVNKHNPDFVENVSDSNTETGHKLSLSYTMDLLAKLGVDTQQLWRNIKRIAVKTLCSAQPKLSHLYKAARGDEYQYNLCFEVLGLDIILDHKAKPWLLEVNYTPSFATGSKLDLDIKSKLIRDTLVLLNQSPESRREIVKARQRETEARILTGKRSVLSREEKDKELRTLQYLRDKFCSENLGNFDQAYPSTDPKNDEAYDKFITAAVEEYSNATGNKKSAVLQKEAESNQLEPKMPRYNPSKTPIDRTKSLMVQQRMNNRPSTCFQKKIELDPIQATYEYSVNLQLSQNIPKSKPLAIKSTRPESVDLQTKWKGSKNDIQMANFQNASPVKERNQMKYNVNEHNNLIDLRQRNYAEEYMARKQGYYTKIMESVNEVKAIIENFPSNLATALNTKKQSPVNQFAEFMKNQFPQFNKVDDEVLNKNIGNPRTKGISILKTNQLQDRTKHSSVKGGGKQAKVSIHFQRNVPAITFNSPCFGSTERVSLGRNQRGDGSGKYTRNRPMTSKVILPGAKSGLITSLFQKPAKDYQPKHNLVFD